MGEFNKLTSGNFGVMPQVGRGELSQAEVERRITLYENAAQGDDRCPSCYKGRISKWKEHTVPKVETGPKGVRTLIEGAERIIRTVYSAPCPDCSGMGMTQAAAKAFRKRSAGIPEVMSSRMGFETFQDTSDMQHVLRQVHAWAWQPTGGIVLAGPTGRGKTHLAVAAACHLAEAGVDIMFVESRTLLDRLKQGISDGTYDQRLQRLKQATVLVLDDYGSERQTDFSEEIIESVLSYRYEMELGFLVTTNLMAQDLSPRLASRMGHKGRVSVLECTGKDWRA
jgi:DNA replication protein DnaC